MPKNIIAQWLNLPNVEISEAVTRNGSTEIYLDRDESLGYICSNCEQKSFWSWDARLVKIRDLSIFAYKAYLNIYKYRIYSALFRKHLMKHVIASSEGAWQSRGCGAYSEQ